MMAQERRGGLFEQDWIRCSEGFSELNAKPGTVRDNGTKKKGISTRSVFDVVKETGAATNTEETSQSIAWSSSGNDSDSETRVDVRKRRRPSAGSHSNVKRRSASGLQAHEDVEVIDLIASDSETVECNPESSGTSSGTVVKTQSTDGGIQGYESDPDIQFIQADVGVAQTDIQGGSQESVDISGSASSTSPPPTQTGGGGTGRGIRAGDWVKSLQLNTPSKADQHGERPDTEDSAKKKKKHARGGMADQLARLQARERSARRIWSHQQHKAVSASQDDKLLALRVVGFEALYSMRLAQCETMATAAGERETSLVMFPASQADDLNLQIGTEITIYPPWQQLQLSDGRQILLCTRNCRVGRQPDSVDSGDPVDSTLARDFQVAVSLKWNCPCVQGLCKNTTLCPAFRYPCVPGIIQDSPAGGKKQEDSCTIPPRDGHLQTICSPHAPAAPQCGSLLTSIGNSGNTDGDIGSTGVGRGSVCFKGLVHRVVQRMDVKGKRYDVIIEDSCGTVSELQLTEVDAAIIDTNISKCEGKSFTFYGLRVKTRIIREGDPPLFSLIDHVWSGMSNLATSQDSDDTATQAPSKPSPPSFCYVLESDPACNLDVQACPEDVTTHRPVDYISVSLVDPACARCSCLGRLIYCETLKESRFTHILYMTDRTLQIRKSYVAVYVSSASNYSHSMTEKCVFVKDVYLDKGQMQTDTYSIISTHSPNHREQADLQHITPQLPLFDAVAERQSLCSIQGVILEVDESSAYSWDACNFCGGDQLITEPGNQGTLRCALCHKLVTEPDTRMKMEVLLKSPHLSDTVRVDLLQLTIESLLPTDDSVEEGYDMACVLDRSVGPLSCLVVTPGRTGLKDVRLKEINLLL